MCGIVVLWRPCLSVRLQYKTHRQAFDGFMLRCEGMFATHCACILLRDGRFRVFQSDKTAKCDEVAAPEESGMISLPSAS